VLLHNEKILAVNDASDSQEEKKGRRGGETLFRDGGKKERVGDRTCTYHLPSSRKEKEIGGIKG